MLYLASASPRRKVLLEQLGVNFQQITPNVDESHNSNEPPENYVTRLAIAKAMAGYAMVSDANVIVIGSDTTVTQNGLIFGKPENVEDACRMLSMLSGGTHQVMTAVALTNQTTTNYRLSISEVTFKSLTTDEIRAYVDTGEPFGKAGAYAIQGQGAIFIKHLAGSYSGVMGLPVFETAELLNNFDFNCLTTPAP